MSQDSRSTWLRGSVFRGYPSPSQGAILLPRQWLKSPPAAPRHAPTVPFTPGPTHCTRSERPRVWGCCPGDAAGRAAGAQSRIMPRNLHELGSFWWSSLEHLLDELDAIIYIYIHIQCSYIQCSANDLQGYDIKLPYWKHPNLWQNRTWISTMPLQWPFLFPVDYRALRALLEVRNQIAP